jgi:poly-beta-hydroxybutyrate-responsive repressor
MTTKKNAEDRDGGGERPDPKLPGEMLMANLLALLKDWSGYGYELAQRLEEAGFGRHNSGSLYRTLRQMEGLGLISSFWDTSAAGPARRMYSLTRAGQLFLENWIAMLDFHRRTLDIYLGGAREAVVGSGDQSGGEDEDTSDNPAPDNPAPRQRRRNSASNRRPS